MPMILEKRVQKLLRKGMPKSEAYGVATKQLQNAGKLQKGSDKLAK